MSEPAPTPPLGEAELAPVGAEPRLGGNLRERAARGTVVNTAFQVGVAGLGLIRSFVVAAFLTRGDYGIWGIFVVALGTLAFLKQAGVSDRYIQQDDGDQELAFQRAFTLELIVCGGFGVLLAIATPLLALLYGRPEIIAPGLLAAALSPVGALQAPTWVFYRRMDFVRQRVLNAVDPVVSTVATIGLAIAGAGYWSLVLGFFAGVLAGAGAAVLAAPYRLALRYDRGTMRAYLGFSSPLVLAGLGALVAGQGSVLVGQEVVGLAGVGVIALASQVVSFTDGVDRIVTTTLYPAVCTVRERVDLLRESFLKTNRLGLMWGLPFGIGVTLFAADLVHLGIGERWRPAIGLIEIFGVVAALNHVAYNWDAFLRARAQTRPIAVYGLVGAGGWLVLALPLLILDGLRGLGIGMGLLAFALVLTRVHYLRRLLPDLPIGRHVLRSVAPVLPGTAAVLVLRLAGATEHSVPAALGMFALYVALTAAATFALERELLAELLGYLRGRSDAPAPITT